MDNASVTVLTEDGSQSIYTIHFTIGNPPVVDHEPGNVTNVKTRYKTKSELYDIPQDNAKLYSWQGSGIVPVTTYDEKGETRPCALRQAQGHIRTTEGNIVDFRRIEADIKEIASGFVVKEIAYDRYNATQIILNLQDEGLTMVPFGQGFKDMSPATKEIFTLVLKNRLIHNHHPVLRWNFDNVCVETDPAENIKPSKKHSTERIDGAVASIMVLDRAVRNIGQCGDSVYEERGLLVL